MKIIAVIPAYNEAAAIAAVLADLQPHVTTVIVVDDGSTDATAAAATAAGAFVVRHELNLGQGAALQTGIACALNMGADIVVTFDADGQFVASEIAAVVEPLLLGRADVALGSRFLRPTSTIPWSRKLVLKLAVAVTRGYTGLKVTDVHNGFRAFSAAAAGGIAITQNRMAHASEIIEQIKKHHLRFVEVPVTIRYTDYSLRKGQKASHSLRIVWDLFFSRLTR